MARKLFVSGFLYEACFRAQEGLPLPCNPITRLIVESVLARAQTAFPIILCHFVVMSNHVHLLFVVQEPKNVWRFMHYVKRELSHSLNRLRGRRSRTVWTAHYCPIAILDSEMAIKRIAYFLTNPQKAGLVDKIEDYPGLSSWTALLNGKTITKQRRVNRDSISALPRRPLNMKEMRSIARSLMSDDPTEYSLVVDPNAWMQCFDATKDKDPDEVNAQILEQIRLLEEKHRDERSGDILGSEMLKHQSIYLEHEPKKHQPSVICMSVCRELRIAFIRWLREHLSCLADGILPPGCFLPGGKQLANVNPLFVPCANNFLLFA